LTGATDEYRGLGEEVTATKNQAAQWINLALEAFKARDRDACAALLIQAVQSDAPLGQGWGAVSRLASMIGEAEAALVAARRFAAVDPAQPGPWLALGQMLAHHGRLTAAETVGVHLTQERGADAAAWHFLGTCRAQLGDAGQSMLDLRRAVALAPSPAASAPSWHAIAEAKTFQADDPDFEAMVALVEAIPARNEMDEARSTAFYALGKAFHDRGEADRAFAAYAQAAAILKPHRHYDADATDRFVETVVSGWTADFHARLPEGLDDDGRPIFVLGLPRSGTTLVEQILVSHEAVMDGAELNLFSVAAMPVRGFTPEAVGGFVQARGAAGLTGVGRAYRRLLDQRFGPDGRVVDKTLNHSRYLGLIAKVLPQARFIWLRRSPGAVAWSCLRTRFAGGVDWSLSLGDMGRYFVGEDRLYAHWTAVLGDRILTVPYEDLVVDAEPWIARILEHAGLPLRPGLKDFHLTKRAVTTASFAQVRRPLYTTSREAWRRYQSHLQPVFDAYGQAPH
jgi:cytochrome c-type biogenesis protein CcmH/NrfG